MQPGKSTTVSVSNQDKMPAADELVMAWAGTLRFLFSLGLITPLPAPRHKEADLNHKNNCRQTKDQN